MAAQVKLTASAPHPPTLFEAVRGLSTPLLLVFAIVWHGLPTSLVQQLSTWSPRVILSPWAWRDAIWGNGSPAVLKQGDRAMYSAKKEFVGQAYGVVLEVGAGSGETIKYYEEAQIDKLYALEPFPPLLKHLRKIIAARGAGFQGKSVVVPLGIQERSLMRSEYGIAKESIDTLVLVQCLCSMPQPERQLKFCVELLKPGGTLILVEHVSSSHPTTRLLQDLITPVWSFIANGCELNRDTIDSIQALQCWEDVVIKRPEAQTTADLIPHVFLKATKSRR